MINPNSLALASVVFLLVGCAAKPTSFSQVEFSQPVVLAENFYVERHPGDKENYAALIRDELIAHGVKATSGPARARPADTDIIVRYADRYAWSFSTFLASLAIMLYDVENEDLLVAGRADSVAKKAPPEAIVREAVASIFRAVPRTASAPL